VRDIKFRAWDKNKKEMITHFALIPTEPGWSGTPIEQPTKEVCEELFRYDSLADYTLIDWSNWYGIINFIIMQYTGLKDKNGLGIFEGDLLRSWEDEEWWIYGIVTYSDYNGAYFLADKEGFITDWDMADEPSEWDKFEVIGNLYENPELLEGK